VACVVRPRAVSVGDQNRGGRRRRLAAVTMSASCACRAAGSPDSAVAQCACCRPIRTSAGCA